MGTNADRAPKARSRPRRTGQVSPVFAMLYTALTFAATWSCWGASWFALRAGGLGPGRRDRRRAPGHGDALPAARRLRPVRARPPRAGWPAPRRRAATTRAGGFWRFAFGGVPSPAGWAAFAALAVTRWAMFRLAFGFPATPADALANFAVTLPALLLGGGLEEVGWRGCLQSALRALLGGGLSDAGRAAPGRLRASCWPRSPPAPCGPCGTCRSSSSPARSRTVCRSSRFCSSPWR